MQSSNPPPDGLGREYRAWFGFWAELVVLGAAAIAIAFLRLKRRFDGAPTRWERFLLVDDTRNLWLVIAVVVALGLAGLFVAAAEQEGSLHVAGVALFATSGLIVFLSLKNVFDNLDRRSQD